MRTLSALARVTVTAAVGLAISLGAPPRVGFTHEQHQMECSESSLNAMTADVQAMPDGKAKATATKEIEAARDTMRKKDMKTCMAHMHNAMEAIDE